MRLRSKAVAAGVGAAGVMVLSLGVAMPTAFADAGLGPGKQDVVGVGSDTVQDAIDFLADGDYVFDAGYNAAGNKYRLINFDATADRREPLMTRRKLRILGLIVVAVLAGLAALAGAYFYHRHEAARGPRAARACASCDQAQRQDRFAQDPGRRRTQSAHAARAGLDRDRFQPGASQPTRLSKLSSGRREPRPGGSLRASSEPALRTRTAPDAGFPG